MSTWKSVGHLFSKTITGSSHSTTLMKIMANSLQCTDPCWSMVEQSEITLLHSAQAGDLESFNALVLKYQDVMYRTALRILGQDALAEDVTQNAFVSAYQHIIDFRGGSPKACFMRILVNQCYDDIRRMQRTAALSFNESLTDDGENESLYSRFQNHVPSVEECVEASERNEYIQECLRKLPTDYRVILALVDIEEMSYGEASTILRIPMGTNVYVAARSREGSIQEAASNSH